MFLPTFNYKGFESKDVKVHKNKKGEHSDLMKYYHLNGIQKKQQQPRVPVNFTNFNYKHTPVRGVSNLNKRIISGSIPKFNFLKNDIVELDEQEVMDHFHQKVPSVKVNYTHIKPKSFNETQINNMKEEAGVPNELSALRNEAINEVPVNEYKNKFESFEANLERFKQAKKIGDLQKYELMQDLKKDLVKDIKILDKNPKKNEKLQDEFNVIKKHVDDVKNLNNEIKVTKASNILHNREEEAKASLKNTKSLLENIQTNLNNSRKEKQNIKTSVNDAINDIITNIENNTKHKSNEMNKQDINIKQENEQLTAAAEESEDHYADIKDKIRKDTIDAAKEAYSTIIDLEDIPIDTKQDILNKLHILNIDPKNYDQMKTLDKTKYNGSQSVKLRSVIQKKLNNIIKIVGLNDGKAISGGLSWDTFVKYREDPKVKEFYDKIK